MLSLPGSGIKGTSAYNNGMGEPERAFVVLRHETREGVHWDLMLDTGGSLATWKLAEDPTKLSPQAEPGAKGVPARRLPDHRRAYLDYEGPVGGNRGQVTRVDRGTCKLVRDDPQSYAVRLAGERLTGLFEFRVEATGSDLWHFVRVS